MNPPDHASLLASIGGRFCLLLLLALLAGGCRQDSRRLTRLQNDYRSQFPEAAEPASPLAELPVVSPTANQRHLRRIDLLLDHVATIREQNLTPPQRSSYARFKEKLHRRRQHLLTEQTDPAFYNFGGHLNALLSNDSLSPRRRDSLLLRYLQLAPAYYDSAKAILRQPDPERTRLAIQKQRYSLVFLEDRLLHYLPPSTHEEGGPLLRLARFAVKDYLAYCESVLFEQQDSILRRR